MAVFKIKLDKTMKTLSFSKTKKLLLKYKIPFCRTKLAKSKKEAEDFAKNIGYPVVLKISSPDIFHRTEIRGVKTNIRNKKELREAWDEILIQVKKRKPEAEIEGILVQEELKGIEVILGMKRDKQFGPVLMFGLGGIFSEVLKDTSLRIAPVSKSEAKEMIKEIRGYEVLKGFRGRGSANIKKIIETIVNLSNLSFKEEIAEIDLNPIIISKKRALAVDACFYIYERNIKKDF